MDIPSFLSDLMALIRFDGRGTEKVPQIRDIFRFLPFFVSSPVPVYCPVFSLFCQESIRKFRPVGESFLLFFGRADKL